MSALQLLPKDFVLDVPTEVAVCPYCGAALSVQFEWWQLQDDGSWAAVEVHADCTAEPDIETGEWTEWYQQHSQMPYVYQLPVDTKVGAWVNSYYRFNF